MGTDKAMLRLRSVTLLERACSTLEEAGFAVAVSVADAGSPAALQLAGSGIPIVRDKDPEQGPLGGIVAALESVASESQQPVLFLPVDVPLLPPEFLLWLWRRAVSSGAAATIPAIHGREQPLCAVYRSKLAAPLRHALAGGERKVMRAISAAAAAGDLDRVSVEAVTPLMGWYRPQLWFTNVNTPGDWAAVEQATLRGQAEPSRI
jgi:molybdopterin-guanine dinucleotide biosynthesis protein A